MASSICFENKGFNTNLFSESIGNHACIKQKLIGSAPCLETRLRFGPVGETGLWEVEGKFATTEQQPGSKSSSTQCFYRTRVALCSSHACHQIWMPCFYSLLCLLLAAKTNKKNMKMNVYAKVHRCEFSGFVDIRCWQLKVGICENAQEHEPTKFATVWELIFKGPRLCEICGSHVSKARGLLGCKTVYFTTWLPTFQKNALPSLRSRTSRQITFPGKEVCCETLRKALNMTPVRPTSTRSPCHFAVRYPSNRAT